MKYRIHKTGSIIYKNIDNENYLIVTPIKNPNKRIVSKDFVELNTNPIKTPKALEVISEQWRNYSTKWKYQGKTYKVDKNLDFDFLANLPIHTFISTTTSNVKQCNLEWEYYLGYFHGKLIWFNLYGGTKRCFVVPFNKETTTPPKINKSWWTGLHNIKPVYCMDTKQFI